MKEALILEIWMIKDQYSSSSSRFGNLARLAVPSLFVSGRACLLAGTSVSWAGGASSSKFKLRPALWGPGR
jgi:hypothetical protein